VHGSLYDGCSLAATEFYGIGQHLLRSGRLDYDSQILCASLKKYNQREVTALKDD
jgi:hypothetical protein